MIRKGIAKGKLVELEESLPYPEGQPVRVSVEPVETSFPQGSPAALRTAMHKPPHLTGEEVDELDRAIEAAKIQVDTRGPFDVGR